VVGVRFKEAGKIYYFDPGKYKLGKDQHVIVETARGVEYGEVVIGEKEVKKSELVAPLKKVMRIASSQDAETVRQNREDTAETFRICQEKIAEHELDMNLIDVEYTFDRNKIIFYFTAEGRIDFRELVKDLAAIFRTRIELRQVGVRDEAKLIGGIGQCGRELCCKTFLGEFEPVSIKMAKDQNLSLNPIKISGLCSRLMCCLKYESCNYESKGDSVHYPAIGSNVMTSLGAGRVKEVNKREKIVLIELSDTKKIESFPLDEVAEGDEEF
jgi:cell fate regulator YaaT (PSP1 superfamily)